jgi:RHS repeat-associated protein
VYTDLISGWISTQKFAYHEGYYDPFEFQFRGFGFIESWDGEEAGETSMHVRHAAASEYYKDFLYAPVTYTKSWYMVGDYTHQPKILERFRDQFFKGDKDAYAMPDSVLSAEIDRFDEYTIEHAYQALNGKLVHEEVYGLDEKKDIPYTVTESNYTVRQVQPRGGNRYPSMQVISRESIFYNYERKADDPGAVHTFNLATDEYGHTLLNSQVFYARRAEHYRYPGQTELKLTADTTLYNEPCADAHILGVICETRSFEITGASPAGRYYTFDEIKGQVEEALNHAGQSLSSATIGWQRNYFWDMEQVNHLPLRQLTSRALMHHQRKAVFSEEYIMDISINGKKVVTTDDLVNEAGYIHDEGYFWNPGMIGYYYKEKDNRYFLPFQADNYWKRASGIDSLKKRSKTDYDEYQLKMVKHTSFLEDDEVSAYNHISSADIDYIFLKEKQLTDINGNLSQVLFDPLGQVVVTTQFKPGNLPAEILEGDMPVSDYNTSVLEDADFNKVIADPPAYLQKSSTFFYYDIDAWQRDRKPVSSIKLARDKYVKQDPSGTDTNIFVEVNYNDGFGRALETKVLTRGGISIQAGENLLAGRRRAAIRKQETSGRWIVSGKKIYNNKGKEALLYESFYSPTPYYEEQQAVQALLPPPVCNTYDALVRVIREDSPKAVIDGEVKGFFSVTEREAWQIITYDKNDTVTRSSYYQWFMSTDPPGEEDEKDALEKAALCENTPSKEIFDVKGNTILKISDNIGKVLELKVKGVIAKAPVQVQQEIWDLYKTNYLDADNFLREDFRPYDPSFSIQVPPPLEPYKEEVLAVQDYLAAGCMTSLYKVDIQGRTLLFIDARLYYNNVRHGTEYYSNKYRYDLSSPDALYTDSPDSGQRLGLQNMFGNLFKAWDARSFLTHTAFDRLERPVRKHISGTEEAPAGKAIPGWTPLVLDNTVEIIEFGETAEDAKRKNLFGQAAVLKDQAGVITNSGFTLNAKPASTSRVLLKDYKQEVNWLHDPALEADAYIKSFRYTVQGSVLEETDLLNGEKVFAKSNKYNVSGALMAVDQVTYTGEKGTPVAQTVISDIDYYPNRQPSGIWYGNGTRSVYTYEYTTQRMTGIDSSRSNAGENTILQSIRYTYDPVGNITRVTDNSFEPVHCYGQEVKPLKSYSHDCLYQLLNAGGRQHIGVNGNSYKNGFKESAYMNFCSVSAEDSVKLVNYSENYGYDLSGNMLKLQHITHDPAGTNWTNNNEVLPNNNQLAAYRYDRNGNQLFLYEKSGTPLGWDYRNLLASAIKLERVDHVNDQEYYVYDSGGMRVRKVTERVENEYVNTEEIIYLDGWEIKRVKSASGLSLERYTKHILAEKKQAAILYYWKNDRSKRESTNGQQLQMRYQLGDLQSSIALELDDQGSRITYEEYFPYGGSALVSGTSEAEVKLKYYRFTGKECDDSTGLYYFGARYYAPYLGRWISTDPKEQFASPYTYSYNNPTTATDPDGQWAWLIPIAVGALITAYTGYKAGKSQGASGAKLAAYTVAGGTIGAVSGGVGGYIASASVPLAQTLSMAVTSTASSKAMSYITGGSTTTSVGVASYDWSTQEVSYLFKGGVRNGSNTLSQNVGYTFGALANISDIMAGFSGTTVQLVTECESIKPNSHFDYIGHSALVNPAEGIDVSVGPIKGYFPPISSPTAFIGGLFKTIEGRRWDNYFGTPNGYTIPIYNVNKNILKDATDYITANTRTMNLPYSGIGYSCVDYTSKALWKAGVIHFYPPLHPYGLPMQMMARQTGIFANPYLVSSKSNQHEHEE